jgi:hypothetical protein
MTPEEEFKELVEVTEGLLEKYAQIVGEKCDKKSPQYNKQFEKLRFILYPLACFWPVLYRQNMNNDFSEIEEITYGTHLHDLRTLNKIEITPNVELSKNSKNFMIDYFSTFGYVEFKEKERKE